MWWSCGRIDGRVLDGEVSCLVVMIVMKILLISVKSVVLVMKMVGCHDEILSRRFDSSDYYCEGDNLSYIIFRIEFDVPDYDGEAVLGSSI